MIPAVPVGSRKLQGRPGQPAQAPIEVPRADAPDARAEPGPALMLVDFELRADRGALGRRARRLEDFRHDGADLGRLAVPHGGDVDADGHALSRLLASRSDA